MRIIFLALISSLPSFGVIVGTNRGITNSNAVFVASQAHTLNAIPAVGSLVLINVGYSSNGVAVSSVIDTCTSGCGNAYTLLSCNTSGRGFCYFWRIKTATTGATYAVTATLASGTALMGVGAVEYTGMLPTSMFETPVLSQGNSAVPTCTGLNTSLANEMVVTGFYNAAATAVVPTIPLPYVIENYMTGNPRISATADAIQAAAGATGTITWGNLGGSSTWTCIVTAIKPLGGMIHHKVTP